MLSDLMNQNLTVKRVICAAQKNVSTDLQSLSPCKSMGKSIFWGHIASGDGRRSCNTMVWPTMSNWLQSSALFPGVWKECSLCVFVSLTCAAGGSLADRVSQVTVTDEGPLRVLTVPTQTDVWIQLALIHI